MDFLQKVFSNGLKKEKLLLRDAKKDKEKFGEIYKYLVNDVYRYTYAILKNRHDAEDITSQVFVEFYKKFENFQWKGLSMKFWLFRTSRNLSLRKLKKPAHESLVDYDIPDETEISFVDEIIQKDLVHRVQNEILNLEPSEREILALRIWEGFKFNEIAEIQNISENAAKKRFYSSIEKLKRKFEKKKIKPLFSLPLLFTTIFLSGTSKAFAAPKSVSNIIGFSTLIIKKETLKNTIMNKIGTIFSAKAGILAGGLTAFVTVAGFGGYYLYTTRTKDMPEVQTSIMPELTPTPLEPTATEIAVIIPTPTPTIIPQISPEESLKPTIPVTINPEEVLTPTDTPELENTEAQVIQEDTSSIKINYPMESKYSILITQYYSDYHKALDITTSDVSSQRNSFGEFEKLKVKIISAADGVVVYAGVPDELAGYTIRIDHGNGYQTQYAHIEEGSFLVQVGQKVSAGQELATMGMTGAATGVHVHFSISKDGENLNPMEYFN